MKSLFLKFFFYLFSLSSLFLSAHGPDDTSEKRSNWSYENVEFDPIEYKKKWFNDYRASNDSIKCLNLSEVLPFFDSSEIEKLQEASIKKLLSVYSKMSRLQINLNLILSKKCKLNPRKVLELQRLLKKVNSLIDFITELQNKKMMQPVMDQLEQLDFDD